MTTIPRSEPAIPGSQLGSRGRAWAIVAMIVLLMMINFGDKAVMGLAAKPLMEEMGLDATRFGAVSSSFYLLFSLSALVVGFVSNRVSTTTILGVIALLWSLATLPILILAAVPMLYLSRITLGGAEGPTAPIAAHAVQKWFPEQSRAVPTALTTMGGALGLAVTAPTLTYFITNHGWRSAFAVLAVAGLLWAAAWSVIGKEGPYRTYRSGAVGLTTDPIDEHVVSHRRLFTSRTWLGGLIGGMGAYWALAVATAWLPTLLERGRGYSTSKTALLVAVPSVFAAVAILAVPFVSERLIRRGISARLALGVTAGVTVLIAGVAAIAAGHTSGPLLIVLVAIAFGLPSAFYPLSFLMCGRISPVRQRGAVMATATAVTTLTGVVAPVVTGRVIDAAGGPEAAFTRVFLIAGVILIVCGAVSAAALHPDADARRFDLQR
ncbi:MFS transporter [Tsukamurella sp. 8F]|uniref:MFS transporter n=1 Tax=unclassified Tsukamurella TaxID=2633480 RepID=UPI0023B9B7BC|nr:MULTISPECIES: MFS transporter [unclassified Tsukamurella]MDF0530411.1 MFS transporter [Tsukamurella sp. 8J]MDF0587768.1 MFS transporter [Tsukamurella sp. 8F]